MKTATKKAVPQPEITVSLFGGRAFLHLEMIMPYKAALAILALLEESDGAAKAMAESEPDLLRKNEAQQLTAPPEPS